MFLLLGPRYELIYKMKHLSIFFILFLFGHFNAQTFYFSTKIERAFYLPSNLNSIPFNSSPNYFIEKQNVVLGDGFSPLNFGLTLGYRFNKKFSIETGFQQDGSVTGYNIYFKSPKYYDDIQKTLYESQKITFSQGISSSKMPIMFQYAIIQRAKSKLSISNITLNTGFSILIKTRGNNQVLTSTTEQIITENSIITIQSDLLSFEKRIGLALNFSTGFSINWNKINLFDLNLGINYSKSTFTNMPVTITENTKSSIYRFSGTPSKLFIQLSRDFLIKKKSKHVK